MKKLVFLSMVLMGLSIGLMSNVNAQGVGINSSGNLAAPSAILDVSSTTKGTLITRMTTVQRNTITSPAVGLLIFNTDCNSINYYNGSAWIAVSSNGAISNIAGNPNPCQNAIGIAYSISPVANAISYNWTVPAGGTVAGGQGKEIIF